MAAKKEVVGDRTPLEEMITPLVDESLGIICSSSELARRYSDDLRSQAMTKLMRAFSAQLPANPGGFVHVTVRNLVADLSRNKEINAEALDAVPGGDPSARMVSLPAIQKEAKARQRVTAFLLVELLPDEADRALLFDRFYGGLSLRELGVRHGGVGEAAISNRLTRLLGNDRTTGVLQPVLDVVGDAPLKEDGDLPDKWLSLDALSVVARLVTRTFGTRTSSQRIADACGYLQNLSGESPAHAQLARSVISRLGWIDRNLPGTRGARNKITRRLVDIACAYVMEPADARHDERGVEGLLDDARLVEAVQWAVRRNGADS